MAHEENELRFANFLSSETPEPETQPEVDEAGAEATDGVLEHGDTAAETEDAGSEATEQAAPEPEERVTFESRGRARGYELPGELDTADLYDQAWERIAAGTQAIQERDALRAELERLKSQQPPSQYVPAAPTAQPEAAAPEAETPAEQVQRLFRELQEYDPSLNQYVTRENGQVVPRPEYGQTAIDAAKAIAAYERAEQEQARLLLHNPSLLIKEHLSDLEKMAEAKAQAVFEKKMGAWQEEQQKQREEHERASQERDAQARFDQWHESNKAKLFALAPNGDPMRSPFDGNETVKTPIGKYFMSRLPELERQLPGVDRLAIFDIALREAELAVPKASPQQEMLTPAEKAKKFAQQRTAPSQVPNQNVPPATSHEIMSERPVLKFADMLRSIPENQEVMSNW